MSRSTRRHDQSTTVSEKSKLDVSQGYVKFLTFNTWGLKHVSKFRQERLCAIADKLAGYDNFLQLVDYRDVSDNNYQLDEDPDDYDVVALQEVWCKSDWDYIVDRCKGRYPYHRWFLSGMVAGPGLAILSKIPIESTFLYRFPINGRPSAFFRGDWYVGKSVSITLLKQTSPNTPQLCIMNSHMHAPYALEGDAAYDCHRTCQAWDFSRLANLYRKSGYAVVIVGDLNCRPASLPFKLLTKEADLEDSWEQLNGKQDLQYIARLLPMDQIKYGGVTCDSTLNTWRADRGPQEACRLDHALIDPQRLQAVKASVKFTERIPNVGSFSDHFGYSCTLKLLPTAGTTFKSKQLSREELILRISLHEEILQLIYTYMSTSRWQQLWRAGHFWLSVVFIAVIPIFIFITTRIVNWLSIFWVFISVIITATGLLDGLISYLFGNSELRALEEVGQEVRDSKRSIQASLDTSVS
ncbi:HCL618Cp [Eremothecium sinecaudum]|uniref:HCL618Cp n=1 Tax=Eremothecium sinecaudum TaxID=45286 RepID=A0A109UXV1_9SACH|nr:HCL618Cp [Eremothecium sinecaudum]AMD19533.1 HCL618Cp [Eremothecium sinecaudum]